MRASENPHLSLKSYSLLDRASTICCCGLSQFRINYAKQLTKGKKSHYNFAKLQNIKEFKPLKIQWFNSVNLHSTEIKM